MHEEMNLERHDSRSEHLNSKRAAEWCTGKREQREK